MNTNNGDNEDKKPKSEGQPRPIEVEAPPFVVTFEKLDPAADLKQILERKK